MSRKKGPRISSGSLRGRTLEVPEGKTVRPMRTRVREAMFNHLATRVRGARFLDVFAGSGAIGIEALSRGAHRAVLVENGATVLPILRRNVANLDLGKRCEILTADIHREGIGALVREDPFDLVFLDPPFPDFRGGPHPRTLLEAIVASRVLVDGGLIGCERPSDLSADEDPPGSEIEFRREYGDTTLEFWRKITPEPRS
ncbi:MAG: 16S rRNA (guanine(966)-N(2))-methyltransferase RsmD [Planctomycetota bacterium]